MVFSSKGKVLKYEKQKQESKLFTVHRLNIPIMDYWGCFTFAFEVSHVDSNISLETLEIHSSLAASEISHKQMNEFGNFLYKFFFLFFLFFWVSVKFIVLWRNYGLKKEKRTYWFLFEKGKKEKNNFWV